MKKYGGYKMAKLRKMLGNIEDPIIVELMRLIETQSKTTLAAWAIDYAEENYLGIYEKEWNEDHRFRKIIAAAHEFLDGEMKLKDVKPFLKEAHQVAKEAEGQPAAQAAARAVATACAVIQTPTSALGYTFYGAAAVAYDKAGLLETQEVYDALAAEEFARILRTLQKAAVEDEANPAKINWNC